MKKLWILALAVGSAAVVSAPMALKAQATPAAQAAPAAAKPDFTGTWTLDLGKSVYGPVPSPNSEINVVSQSGDDFKIAFTQVGGAGTLNYTVVFKADGTEVPIPKDGFPANSDLQILSTKGEWQNGVLVLTQKATYQGMNVTISARYTLSDDGKELTKLTNYSTEQGDYDTKTVYAKS